jgi:hypothetical protein
MMPVLQSTAAECGLASLAMIAEHHGLCMDLSDLRRRFQLSLKGATLQQLTSQAVKSLALTRITMAHRPETVANASRDVREVREVRKGAAAATA